MFNLTSWSLRIRLLALALIVGPPLLYGGYRYVHWQGYQQGYQQAELLYESELSAQKDGVIASLVEGQKSIISGIEKNLAQNVSINEKLNEEDETRAERIETIVKEQPIYVSGDCSVDYSYVELFNSLAEAGTSTSDDRESSSPDNPTE